ncbi:ketosynthase chain-length factor [Streptomonospora arabica]|uniref:Ketosynthase chain-length factor n=1 Tax=Streptomonospora arabica TaxID=412417 RepID=A0ABV9SDL9_9ACTN
MSGGAVVTGLGIVAPNGFGAADYWEATLHGRSGIGPLTRFEAGGYPAQLAGEVPDFEPADHLPRRLIPQTDHMTRLALVAAEWALADAGADPAQMPEYAAGVTTASASGGFEFGQRELEKLWSRGPEHVSAYQSFAWFYAVNTGQISIRHGMKGPSGVLVTEQAGGLDAVAQARRHVRDGTGVVVTGGVDASLCPWGWTAQIASGGLSGRRDPDRAYLPFDADACGYVPGEGGAILTVEDPRSAARRGGCRAYGEIAGYGATFDPPPWSDREPGLRRAIETALADAGAGPDEVDAVFADAAGLPEADRREAEAVDAVFGGRTRPVPVTAPKTMTGRLYSGGAALDTATALLAMAEDVVPPTVNVTDPAPYCDLDLVIGEPRNTSLHTCLVLARGYGGFNSALVLRRAE